jgi:ubiquinone/menaquinone biosynthesis C-methylase UbiE
MLKEKIAIFILILSLVYILPMKSANQQEDHHKRSSDDRVFYFERQTLTIDNFEAEGYILDIGGGGEGVIGQLKEEQVVAIDISKRELEEAPGNPLKIIMDARDLKFLNNTFNTAAVFFTFMYIDSSDHEQVFKELYRVMRPGGRLFIWDVVFPKRDNNKKEIAVFPFTFKLPDREIKTGYGARWPEKGQGISHYLQLAQKTKFKVIVQKTKDRWFFLELKK